MTLKYEIPSKPKANLNGKMKGEIVVFTGGTDKAIEAKILSEGGTVGSSVSSKTTIVVAKDLNSGSSKLTKAKSLGITVITMDKLKEKLS